jgi:hypothetical protein
MGCDVGQYLCFWRWGEGGENEALLGRRSHKEVNLGPEVGRQPCRQCLNQGTFFYKFKHCCSGRRAVSFVGGSGGAGPVGRSCIGVLFCKEQYRCSEVQGIGLWGSGGAGGAQRRVLLRVIKVR